MVSLEPFRRSYFINRRRVTRNAFPAPASSRASNSLALIEYTRPNTARKPSALSWSLRQPALTYSMFSSSSAVSASAPLATGAATTGTGMSVGAGIAVAEPPQATAANAPTAKAKKSHVRFNLTIFNYLPPYWLPRVLIHSRRGDR